MGVLYPWSTEALDVALACRSVLSFSDDKRRLQRLVSEAEERIRFQADMRARSHRRQTGARMVYLEEEIQALLVAVLRQDPLLWSPGGIGVVDVHHSPLGAFRGRLQAAAMARAGATAGWPDLDIRLVGPGGPVSLLLELKAGRVGESKRQRERRQRLQAAGFQCYTARGFGDSLNVVLSYLMR